MSQGFTKQLPVPLPQNLGGTGALNGNWTPINIIGTTTNNNALAGAVGEFVSSIIVSSSAVSLTTAVNANITSISLTAGDWNVWGNIALVPAGTTTILYGLGWISNVSATSPDSSSYDLIYLNNVSTASFNVGIKPPSLRFSLASTTTIYLSLQVSFAVSTMGACGAIYARRVR